MPTETETKVPALAHDAMMKARFNHDVTVCGRMERRIVWRFCEHMARAGWQPCEVHDFEETTPVADAKAAMELIFNLDHSRLYFRKGDGPKRWVYLVNGNGEDMISDYVVSDRDGFGPAVDAFNPSEHV